MEPTSHYTPSSKLEKRIPTAAYQLAVSYHLGTPIKEYRDNLVPRLVNLGLMFDVLGLFFMLFTVNTIVAFYFGNKQGGNNIFSIPFMSTTTSSNNSIHTD